MFSVHKDFNTLIDIENPLSKFCLHFERGKVKKLFRPPRLWSEETKTTLSFLFRLTFAAVFALIPLLGKSHPALQPNKRESCLLHQNIYKNRLLPRDFDESRQMAIIKRLFCSGNVGQIHHDLKLALNNLD